LILKEKPLLRVRRSGRNNPVKTAEAVKKLSNFKTGLLSFARNDSALFLNIRHYLTFTFCTALLNSLCFKKKSAQTA
jgi:hypothetical protein